MAKSTTGLSLPFGGVDHTLTRSQSRPPRRLPNAPTPSPQSKVSVCVVYDLHRITQTRRQRGQAQTRPLSIQSLCTGPDEGVESEQPRRTHQGSHDRGIYALTNPPFVRFTSESQIGALWRDAPENPNRGKEPKSRKPKAKAAKNPPPKSSNAEASGEETEWCGPLSLLSPHANHFV